ncbi:MAG: NAD(P)-dependent oxidoreductase, partial [Phycisphaerae bacterium]
DGRKPFKIVIAEPFASEAISRLEEIGHVTVLGNSAPDTLIAALPDADALLVRGKAHVTARIIDAAPRLKVIGRASPNIDHIDLRAASRRDIRVVYSPHAAVSSCAEFTLGLILAVHRRILFYDRDLRAGKFETLRNPTGREIGRETIGLLGIDPIANQLGAILSTAFGCKILYHDPYGNLPELFQGESVGLDALLGNADILSIHLRLTKETRGLLNAQQIHKMKTTAVLVNTSRGAVVDTLALAEALQQRRIAGAALDVYEAEPLPTQHPLREASLNCILTPHVAGATLDASEGRFKVADDVVRVLQGEPPEHAVKLPPD